MNAYNFNHLFYFYITAKLDGITTAAKHLNTSQSSLSVQIKNLEHAVGKPLFKKVGRRIELTETGKETFQYCRRAFEAFEEMADHIQKSKTSMGVRINIGVSTDIDRPFVTEAVAKVIRLYSVESRPLVKLISKDSEILFNLLRSGELDFLVTTKVTLDGTVKLHKEIALPVYAFGSKQVKIELKKNSFLMAFKNKESGAVLAAKPTLLRSETESFFVKKRIWPTITFESNILASVARACVDSLGIAILPYVYVNREVKSERISILSDGPLWRHKILIASVKGSLSESKANVVDQVADELEKNSFNKGEK